MKNAYVAPQLEELVLLSEAILVESPDDNEENLGELLRGLGQFSF